MYRFLGLATDLSYCCVRFNSILFDFCKTLQKPRVFARFFACGREPCGCFRAPKPQVLAFPEPTCGSKRLSGACRGRPCLKIHREPRVFVHFLRFCVIQCALCSSLFFQKCDENHAFSRIFGAAGVRFRDCFFVVLSCSLFKNGIRN